MRLFRHHPAEVLGDEVEEPRAPPRRYKRPPPREAPAAPPRAEAPAASVASIVGPGEHAAALARGGASSDLRAGGGTPRAATPLNRPASARPEGGRPATAPRPVSAAGQPVRYLSEEQRAQLNAKYGTLEAPPWAPRPEEVSEHVDAARREERARADADYARVCTAALLKPRWVGVRAESEPSVPFLTRQVQEFLEMEERRRAHASARETPAAADETTRAGCRPPHRRRRRAAPSSFVASLFRACTPSQPLAQAGAAFGLGAAAAALVLAFAVEAASRSEYAERFVSSVVDQLQLAGRVYLRRLTQAADAVSWCIHLATLIVRFVTHFFLAFYRYPRYGWTLFCLVTAGDAARRRWNTANLIREAFTTVDEALGPHRASIIGLCFLSWVIFGEASYVYALPRQFLTEYWDDFRWACLRSQAFLWACTQLWPHAKRLGRVCRLAPQVIALRLQIVWLTIPLHKIVLLVVLLAQPLVDWCVYWPFFPVPSLYLPCTFPVPSLYLPQVCVLAILLYPLLQRRARPHRIRRVAALPHRSPGHRDTLGRVWVPLRARLPLPRLCCRRARGRPRGRVRGLRRVASAPQPVATPAPARAPAPLLPCVASAVAAALGRTSERRPPGPRRAPLARARGTAAHAAASRAARALRGRRLPRLPRRPDGWARARVLQVGLRPSDPRPVPRGLARPPQRGRAHSLPRLQRLHVKSLRANAWNRERGRARAE